MKDEALAARCRALKLLLTRRRRRDDGRHRAAAAGRRARRRRSTSATASAIVLAQRAGLRTGLLTGRSSEVVARRAAELGMAVVRQGVADKGQALRAILAELGLRPEEVAYIGDDVNDLPVLTEVGLSAAPADAPLEVRLQAFMVTDAPRRPRLPARVRRGHPARARRVGRSRRRRTGAACPEPRGAAR